MIQGFYKFTDVQPGDSAEVTVILKRFNTTTQQRDTVAMGSIALPTSASYAMFSVNINDRIPNVAPDSIILIFNSSKYHLVDWNIGVLPSLYVDAIKLEEASGTVELNTSVHTLLFPNPFTETATLAIQTEHIGMNELVLEVYDTQGRLVFALEGITAGFVEIDRNGLVSGNYFYLLKNENAVFASGKMTVQ